MGNGFFDGSKLHFIASSNAAFSGTDEADWKTALEQASVDLYDATLGQVQFGTIFLADNKLALGDAEVLLGHDPGGISSGSRGGFGKPEECVRFFDDARLDPHVSIHEFGHHLWNLGDEYATAERTLEIDKSSPAPDKRTVPIVDPLFGGLHTDELKGALFYVVFPPNGALGRANVVSNTATQLKLDADLPDLVTNCQGTTGYVQPRAKCGDPENTNVTFCIMESRKQSVTDFCDPGNHNGASNPEQESEHHESCWATIISTPAFGGLTPPPGPATPPSADPLNFVRLQANARFALVIDVSGSMHGNKLTYAKHGIAYWLDTLTATTDSICVIAFNDVPHVVLPIAQVGSSVDLNALEAQVNALTASGNTNIRDAIRKAIQQITSLPNVSAVQAAVLLTDGKHNTPAGTSVSETLPDLRSKHVKLAAIGIGGPDDVDMDALNDLATATNGYSSFIDVTAEDQTAIESSLVEANQRLLGVLLDTDSFDVEPPPPERAKRLYPHLRTLYGDREHARLNDVLHAAGTNLASVTGGTTTDVGVFLVRTFYVEEQCDAINATINFHRFDKFDLWLLDPDLHEVTAGDPGARMNTAGHPHRFWMVQRPKSGVWRMLMLRQPSVLANRDAHPVPLHLSVGGQNRALTAAAYARKVVFSTRESVVLEARARWIDLLTGLHVTAEIHDPAGHVHSIVLTDGGLLSGTAGTYTGEFRPRQTGKYRAIVRFLNRHAAFRADGQHLATHAPIDQQIDLRSRARAFQRVVPVVFQVVK